jgi:uncharacterized membrane protein (DUF373 family)
MSDKPTVTGRIARISGQFETVVLLMLHLFLVVLITAGIARLVGLWITNFQAGWGRSTDSNTFQEVFQGAVGGILVILLALELLETVRLYTRDHRVKLEIVMVVAMIALGRHIIQLDYHATGGPELLGIAALVVALAGGYYLVSRAGGRPARDSQD